VAQRLVTVNLDADGVRVVVFQGRRVVAWGTAPIRDSAQEDDQSPLERAQVERLQAVLKHMAFGTAGP